MKILAISDIMQWDGYEFLFDDTQPDLAALVGDLTDDGFREQSITAREHQKK